MTPSIDEFLNPAQLALIQSLTSPAAVQAYLDETPYSASDVNRCPVQVMEDRVAHCLDGALFAAAVLRRLGWPPLLVDLLPDPGRDDDHLLVVFSQNGRWGAVAKSNFVGLRYRDPVFKSIRELVMSYFDVFYNIQGERTLRYYTRPFNLASLDRCNWMGSQAGANAVEKRLYSLAHIPVITAEMAASLTMVDAVSYRAGMLVANPQGIYQPR